MKLFDTKELSSLMKQTVAGILLFGLTCGVNVLTKPSINMVSKEVLCKSVVGIGEVKSTHIILERDKNGKYRNMKDFKKRNKGVVGDTVFNRVSKIYTAKL